jgi:putative spermidine/putrescine transport system permease protein
MNEGPGIVVRLIAWLVLGALAFPLALIALVSFNASPTLVFPPTEFSLRWYGNILRTGSFVTGLQYSAFLAVASTALSLAVGFGVAHAIVRFRFPGRALINLLVMSPLIVPEVVTGIALLMWFHAAALMLGDIRLLFLHTLVVLPYVVRILVANLQRADPNLEHAAMLLGAHPVIAFLRVTLPVLRKGIAAAAIFALVISFQNFTATVFLITTKPTLPIAIFSYIRTENDPTIAALSTLLVIVTALTVLLTDRLLGLQRMTQER